MAVPDTWYAYFHLRGDFDPDEITRLLGISPSETGRQGDQLPRGSARRGCSLWALNSRMARTDPIETHVRDVLDQMETGKVQFAQLSRKFNGTMQLVGYFREREPGVHFDRETLERITEYSLSIDCDFYNIR